MLCSIASTGHRRFRRASTTAVGGARLPRRYVDKALEARMEKEKDERKGRKVLIRDAGAQQEGGRRRHRLHGHEDLGRLVRRTRIPRASWDWPGVTPQCTADIKIERKMPAQALGRAPPWTENWPSRPSRLGTLDQKGGSEKYSISFVLTPTVTLLGRQGDQGHAQLVGHSGLGAGRSAPCGRLPRSTTTWDWFEGTTVEQINAFFGPKCDEVKDELGK